MGSHLWPFQKWCGTEPAALDRELAKEFIHCCYAELLYETGQVADQLAHFVAALRAGKPLLPRDDWLGGAYPADGCASCGRTLAELVAHGHSMQPEFEEEHIAEHRRRCQVQMAPSNRATLPMHFGEALAALKHGHAVRRSGWRPGTRLTLQQQTLPSSYLFLLEDKSSFELWHDHPEDLIAEDWEIYFED